MDIRTYRAPTMHDALTLVRRDLGPEAAVLHTREVRSRGILGWFSGRGQIEVTASAGVNVPSRLPPRKTVEYGNAPAEETGIDHRRSSQYEPAGPVPEQPPHPSSDDLQGQLSDLKTMLRGLCQQSRGGGQADLPESLFHLFTALIDADLREEDARELVERARSKAPGTELTDPVLLKARVARILEGEIHTTGPIAVSEGKRRLVALVGPTGVGKTTTIAKLAAHYRLKERCNVGLITVDTYRIAAVDQLRTYAEIIDLPMEVVSTPREMRQAVRRLESQDLILMDTAGRSPRDEIKIQELKSFLTEAAADEVHLVLSSVVAARTLQHTAERFASVGTTGLIFTKLDEATGLGNLLPVVRSSRLPLSYLTNGQNVPDDIETADPGRLSRLVLAMETVLDN